MAKVSKNSPIDPPPQMAPPRIPPADEREVGAVDAEPAPGTVAPTGPPSELAFGVPQGPRFVHREIPIYPRLARRLGKEGKVLLRLTIDDAGCLAQVDVLESAGSDFTEASLEAVKRSTYAPAVRDGKPVAARALLPVRFELRRPE